jgi:hypothetical protein
MAARCSIWSLAIGTIEVNWARVYRGLERGWRFVARAS